MAFRFIRRRGVVASTPTFVNVYGSGTIYPGSVVEFHRVSNNNRVEPASNSTTFTNIFGISLDYKQGASDSLVRVIPVVGGQLWEADCANTIATNQLFIRHALSSNLLLNNSTTNVNAATGVFVAYAVSKTIYASLSSATMRIIGEFIRSPASYSL